MTKLERLEDVKEDLEKAADNMVISPNVALYRLLLAVDTLTAVVMELAEGKA